MSLVYRIGNFFILIGIFLVGIFVYTDSAGVPYYRYIIMGIGAILVGMLFRWISPPPPAPPESGRFRMLKKRDKKSREE